MAGDIGIKSLHSWLSCSFFWGNVGICWDSFWSYTWILKWPDLSFWGSKAKASQVLGNLIIVTPSGQLVLGGFWGGEKSGEDLYCQVLLHRKGWPGRQRIWCGAASWFDAWGVLNGFTLFRGTPQGWKARNMMSQHPTSSKMWEYTAKVRRTPNSFWFVTSQALLMTTETNCGTTTIRQFLVGSCSRTQEPSLDVKITMHWLAEGHQRNTWSHFSLSFPSPGKENIKVLV